MNHQAIRLADLAERLGRRVEGDGGFRVQGVASLDEAEPGDLSFASSARWAKRLAASKAGAVILPEGLDAGSRPAIRSANPRLDFARVVGWLHPRVPPTPGVHRAALVEDGAHVDPEATIQAGVSVGAQSRIGPRTVLHPNVTVYEDVAIGADCEIHAGCVLRERTQVGDRVVLHPGVVLGSDGFGYHGNEAGELEKIPHVGRVVIGDEVEIGANTTVDKAPWGETRIGRGAKIDNLVMISHGCQIGEGVIIVAQTGMAGGCVVEPRAILMAQTGIVEHIRIGAGAYLGPRVSVYKDVPPGVRVWGTPAMEERAWHRVMLSLAKLPGALRRLRAVERRLDAASGKDDR